MFGIDAFGCPFPGDSSTFSVFLFLSVCALEAGNQQGLVTQSPDSASTHRSGVPSATPSKKVLTVRLPYSPDVKKLSAGAIFQVNRDGYAASSGTLLVHVVEAHEKGHESHASLLVISFENVTLANKQKASKQLRLEAIVAPPNMQILPSLIIVDRYPCDYEANPVGCKEREDQEADMQVATQIRSATQIRLVCSENLKPSKGQPKTNCVSLSEASGAYGFPDRQLALR